MENRFVLRGVPSEVRSIPAAENELLEYLEMRTCWIDRFAWIEDENETLAAIELDLENVRDQAVVDLDGRNISLSVQNIQFTVHAAPATCIHSALLLKKCAENGKERNSSNTKQILHLPDSMGDVTLRIYRSTEGGTGSEAWRGGLLLAQQICQWLNEADLQKGSHFAGMARMFCGRDVLELGAGSAGLPSLALAATSAEKGRVPPRSLVASDSMDEVVIMLRKNVTENNLRVDVRTINWNRLPEPLCAVDCIMFADCVYTERGAELLHDAIAAFLRRGGNVVGVLPDFRVGLASFEAAMVHSGFVPKVVDPKRISTSVGHFHCAGGSSNGYRIIWWSDCRGDSR